ncbi:MAG TPA: 30S ribosome-binding factor RbfA [Actinomycetota bacterium]|nr:30S ribosome-binding factor RbfA [Actinomycetota bacterium]
MPKTYPRAERVEKLAREVLGEALHDLRDPRIGFATVTAVKMSPDLRQARVYVSVLGSEEQRQTSLETIERAVPHLRSVLGREVRLKFLPALEILEDTTAAYGERIETLLREAGVSAPPKVENLDEPPAAEDPKEDA